MRYAVSPQNLLSRHPHYLQVKPSRLHSQIFCVKGNFVGYGQFIAAIDLGPAGQARNQLVNPKPRPQFDQVRLVEECRTGSHEAHVASENVPELRKLVKAAFAQKRTYGREMGSRIRQ